MNNTCTKITKVRMLLLALVLSFSVQAWADQGYAVLTGSGKNLTLTFYYGTKPTTGTVYDTDDTGSSDPGWYTNRTKITSVVFDSSFADARPASCKGWFYRCETLTSITGMQYLNTSSVTNMERMFYYCRGLTSLDVSNFNTSNVTTMTEMFRDCRGLTSLDLSTFNTGNVTDMSYMFYNCYRLTSLDVSNFNTSNVEYMGFMFYGCRGLTSLDLSNFNTSNVKDMWSMFSDCRGLTSLDVSNFNTSNVTNMSEMFYNCNELTSLDVSNFNTSNVTKMSEMFSYCSKLTHLTFGKDFSTESATDKSDVFTNCPKLRYLDFYDSDDTDAIMSVDRSSGMFNGVPATTVIYLPHGSKDVTGVDNVVYTETNGELRCDRYYSIDKVDIEFPRTFRAAIAEYSRSMTGKTYGSVILPYAFESNDDIQAYILSSSKGENQLTFAKASSVPAHTPFVFKKINAAANNAQLIMTNADYGIIVNATRSTNAAEDTWDASTSYTGAPYEVSTSLSGWKSLGYYIREDVTDYDGLYFVQNDKFKAADGTLNLYDHRVLFRPDAAGAAKTFSLTFVDDAGVTAVDAAEVEAGTVDAAVYDASGRRMDKARRGMNIVRMSDGTIRKVVVR